MLVFMLSLLTIFAVACMPNSEKPSPDEEKKEEGEEGGKEEETDDVVYAKDYTPTTFASTSLSNTVLKIGDGVRMVKNSYTLTKGSALIVVYATEIDLSKADIRASCKLSGPASGAIAMEVPYQHMTDWEKANPKQKVLFATNADYFDWVSSTINAFVMDGFIVKDSHKDNNNYDYKDEVASDVPASAPLLFGIKDGKAQIAAIKKYTGDITSSEVKEGVIKSKLFYTATVSGATTKHQVVTNVAPYNESGNLVFINNTQSAYKARKGSVVIKIKLKEGSRVSGTVETVETLDTLKNLTAEDGYAYAVAHPEYQYIGMLKTAKKGAAMNLTVTSEDGTWTGYNTILGCRHALVQNGNIPNTVALETSNSAARTNIPRTAIGIKGNGTVVMFSVEALTYGKYGKDTDTKGLSLSELADFIRYYNCLNAANFDGGGSTQVIIREGFNGSGDPKVIVRSSDTASTELGSSRKVGNVFLVTTKST